MELWPEPESVSRTSAKSQKVVKGFQTGDMVKAVVTKGKKTGVYSGRIAVRISGYFNITTRNGVVQGIGYKSCLKLHGSDGYNYITSYKEDVHSSATLKG
ncbi:MAG: hypothetical protein HQK67_02460 [Desulfamplus sp.]|nr:hypothetical protein [Desulfamplus sp.]